MRGVREPILRARRLRRIKGEHDIIFVVPIQCCTVSFENGSGIRHSVQITAESLFEAAVLALHLFEQAGDPPGPAAHLEVAAQTPIVKREVSLQRVRDWLNSGGRTPKEQALKTRLRDMLKPG